MGLFDKKTKEGKIRFDDGYYVGQIQNKLPNGLGIYRYTNGNRYDGEFKDGKKNGHGVFYNTDGTISEHEFLDGKIIK